MREESAETTPQVLFVCTANRCRSPYMELVFADLMRDDGTLTIGSAGMQTIDGAEIAGPMVDILAMQGIDATAFRSRVLTVDLVTHASVVITADRDQSGQVCRMSPSALRKVFTLRQAARLLADGDLATQIEGLDTAAARLSRLVEMMAHERGLTGPARADDEIVDPWQKNQDVYLRSVRTMYPALVSLADAVR